MRNSILVFAFIFILIASCTQSEDKGILLARAFDNKLYLEDIDIYLPPNTSKEDSIKFLTDYTNSWIKSQVLINQAEKNIFVDELNIDRRVEDYRQTLIIHEYKQRLLSQKLDTNISYVDVNKYYKNNPDDFRLKDNIVQLIYLKLHKNDQNLSLLRRLFRTYKEEEDYDKIMDIAEQNAVNYFITKDNWLLFEDILLEVPIKTTNQAQYLKTHSFIELKEDNFVYMLKINDFKLEGDIAPLSFEYDNVVKIIINKRKIDLLKQMENDIKNNALDRGDVEIYISENNSL